MSPRRAAFHRMQPRVKALLSSEHFSVDGTLIEAWASMKSFKPKDGPGSEPPKGGGRNAEADFRGERFSNETHASTTDPDARLYRKGRGKEAKLCFMGHGLMENRSGLVVQACVTRADGHAERKAAAVMIVRHSPGARRLTLGADKAFDAEDFVTDMRAFNVTPHVAQNESGRRSAIDGRTTRHEGLCGQPAHPQAHRGSLRLDQGCRRAGEDKFRGLGRVGLAFTFAAAAYDLVRLPKLLAST